jgi:hypothetical protein
MWRETTSLIVRKRKLKPQPKKGSDLLLLNFLKKGGSLSRLLKA